MREFLSSNLLVLVLAPLYYFVSRNCDSMFFSFVSIIFFKRHNFDKFFSCCVYTLCLQWKYYPESDFQARVKKQQQIRRQYIDTQGIMLVWQYYITINTFGSIFLDIEDDRNDVSVAI